jgi:hypothetical protein
MTDSPFRRLLHTTYKSSFVNHNNGTIAVNLEIAKKTEKEVQVIDA